MERSIPDVNHGLDTWTFTLLQLFKRPYPNYSRNDSNKQPIVKATIHFIREETYRPYNERKGCKGMKEIFH